ncbi:MAG: hypothetical protein GOV00_01785 [Candidatus Altiarchaeota archaeon]|nr:hypothetical protein [Candidatus Altiarchaeota archaeon]
MQYSKLRQILKSPFWVIYALLVVLFFSKKLMVGWDSSEYLALGKFIFGGLGYASWYRPLVWPLILGALWKIGLPMPFTMQAVSILIYFSIPLITYFAFKDSRRYIGLLIVSQPVFFKYSHLPLSHIIASFFLILSYSTSGRKSGVFAALSGMSRFTFLLFLPFCLWYGKRRGDWKKRLTGMAIVLVPYFLFTTLYFHNPVIQFSGASDIINHPDYLWLWQKDWLFYLKSLVFFSPLLLLVFWVKGPSRVAFLLSLIYFTLLPHKEDRFLIDMIIYAAIAIGEGFRKTPILQSALHLIFLPLIFLPLYSPPAEFFTSIEPATTVVGMDPIVNSYADIHFTSWFHYSSEPPMDADYCVFSKFGVPCPTDHEVCKSRVAYFKDTCDSWDIVGQDWVFTVARRPSNATT